MPRTAVPCKKFVAQTLASSSGTKVFWPYALAEPPGNVAGKLLEYAQIVDLVSRELYDLIASSLERVYPRTVGSKVFLAFVVVGSMMLYI